MPDGSSVDQMSTASGYETLIWEQSGAVGRLTLNRPETLNAWTAQFGGELKRVLEGEAADESVRAVLITGAGRGFSSLAPTSRRASSPPTTAGPISRPSSTKTLTTRRSRAFGGFPSPWWPPSTGPPWGSAARSPSPATS